MPITDEGRLLILELLVKLRKEIENNEKLIPVLEEILSGVPQPDPDAVFGLYRILAVPRLNVRFLPFIGAEIVGKLETDTIVSVMGVGENKSTDDLWGQINTGWIALELGVNIFAEKVE